MNPLRLNESGFSLMEVIVATVVATIAVVGLAYTLGMGRGFIDRFGVGRAAMGEAAGRLETIASRPATDPIAAVGIVHAADFTLNGVLIGTEHWTVDWVDDPVDGLGAADPNTRDLRRATVTVTYLQGTALDSIQLVRLLPAL